MSPNTCRGCLRAKHLTRQSMRSCRSHCRPLLFPKFSMDHRVKPGGDERRGEASLRNDEVWPLHALTRHGLYACVNTKNTQCEERLSANG